MMQLKNPCIVLDDVICTGDYHRHVPARHLPVLARDLAGAGGVISAASVGCRAN